MKVKVNNEKGEEFFIDPATLVVNGVQLGNLFVKVQELEKLIKANEAKYAKREGLILGALKRFEE